MPVEIISVGSEFIVQHYRNSGIATIANHLLEMGIEVDYVSSVSAQETRLEEILRLKNAAVNAVEASPPADAEGWPEGSRYHIPVRWGRPKIDTEEAAPWIVARLPLEVALVLDDPAYH